MEVSVEGELTMSAQVCEFAARSVRPALSSRAAVPASGARLYEFPAHIEPAGAASIKSKRGFLRGVTYALAAEGGVVVCLYALWHFCHIIH